MLNALSRPSVEALESRCLLSDGITLYPLPRQPFTGYPALDALLVGPDHNIYFHELLSSTVGWLTPAGDVSEVTIGQDVITGIAYGPDGLLWADDGTPSPGWAKVDFATGTFVKSSASDVPTALPDSASAGNEWFSIGSEPFWQNSSGQMFSFPNDVNGRWITYLSRNLSIDGNVWFTDYDKIGRITLTGQVTEFSVPTDGDGPFLGFGGFAKGSDGNLWFSFRNNGTALHPRNFIGRITPDGVVTRFELPSGHSVERIFSAADGSIFLGEGNGILTRFDPLGDPSQYVSYQIPSFTPLGAALDATADGSIWFSAPGALDNDPLDPLPITNIVRLDLGALPAPSASFVSTVDGASFEATVASISSVDSNNTSVIIDWGNGQTMPGALVANGQGRLNIVGTSAYAQPGTYPITVTIIDSQGLSAILHSTVHVAANPNVPFLNHLYQALLNRPPDPTGMAGWVSAIANGMSREQVVEQIESSPEYHRDLIASYYQTYLGRTPSDAEINLWLPALNSGVSLEQIRGDFLASAEYATRAGGTGEGFLEAVYRDVLGRPLDPAGRAAWLPFLGNPRNLMIALDLIVYSPEAEPALVQNYYQHYLGRSADQAGLVGWSSMLAGGARDETVLAGILASDEFFSLS